jgi:uncharacterized membrane protein
VVVLSSILCAQTITTFDVSENSNTLPTAINAAGRITGFTQAYGSERSYGFVRERDGTITIFDVPNVIEDVEGCPTDGWTIFFTSATSINSAGQIVGRYMQASPSLLPNCTRLRGFLRKLDGTFTTFGGEWWPQGLSRASANHIGLSTGNVTINASGKIAGWFGTDNLGLPTVGFLRKYNGAITTFGLPEGYPFTFPTAINNRDRITGSYRDGFADHGFLRKRSGMISTFDVPDSVSTYPTGMNSAGKITGHYRDATSRSRGFLLKHDGTFTTFDVASSGQTMPVAINARGQIAGVYLDASWVYHGFLRCHDGTIETFDVPDAIYTTPTSINAKGDITGWFTDASGRAHGFIRRDQHGCD